MITKYVIFVVFQWTVLVQSKKHLFNSSMTDVPDMYRQVQGPPS